MSGRLRWVAVLLMTTVTACGGDHAPPAAVEPTETTAASVASATPSASEPPAVAADALGGAIREALDGDWEAHYFDARADLDGDGRAETVALIAGPMVCGSGGCPVMIFTGDAAGGFVLIGRVSVVQGPVWLSPRGSHGWRNLVVGIGGGGMPGGKAELAHDGSAYPANPTVPPAQPVVDAEGLELLVPEFASYKDGKPVPLPPLAGTLLGEPVYAHDADELRYRVLRALTGQYAQSKQIEVTQAEKDAYVQRQRTGLQQELTGRTARRDAVVGQLASAELSGADRAELESELETLNELIAGLNEITGDPAAESAEDRAARDEIAGAFIWQWKVNQALHREFGGRIVYQQGIPEPLDAYRQFLEAAEARGDFAIADPALAADFWRYYRDASIHDFYEPGSPAEAAALADPWWGAGQ